MIGTVQVKVQAAMPNHPLQPLFAFKGSPSSMRIMDVPKSIGQWNINEVSVLVKYPDNTQAEKVAVRTGNVWIATVEGCETTGRVVKGYEVLASGIDENGNDVSGYVLGSGDVFILERDSSIPEKGVEKFYVKFCETLPANPQKGDIVDDGGTVKMYDGTKWIDMGGGSAEEIGDATLTIKKNGTNVGSFTANSFLNKTIDIAVPSTTSDLVNDSGFITSAAIPSEVSAFENDVGYITAEAIPSQISSFENDVGYITSSAIPSTISSFENDVGYLTSVSWGEVSDKPEVALMSDIPSNVSELENDVGYITASAIPSQVSAFENDVGYLSTVSWGQVQDKPDVALVSQIPTTTASLTNDSGYITASAIPSTVSSFENDIGYLTTVSWGDVTNKPNVALQSELPTTTASLVNDSGFITLSAIPSNVGAFSNDVGYLTTSSQAFVDKRDKNDMDAVVGTTYASWNLSALHGTTYSPSLELKWGTYNVFGEEQECWLVDDDYRQVCFFLLPELNMLYWGVRNQDSSYIAGYGETITLSSDELSIATINGVAEITCTRTSKEGSPEISTIATMKDLQGFQNINEKRDWWDNTYQASVDATGKYTVNKFSVVIGGSSYNLDQFSASGGTSTWMRSSSSYPSITTTDGLNFTLNYDSSTIANFTMGDLKPGPAKGTIGGSNFNIYANFKLTTFALKDYVDAQASSIPSATSDLVNDSGFITASAIPSNVGAFTNDAGYLTAASTTIQSLQNMDIDHELRIREVEKQATGARDWMDLSYPTVNANAQDGFGIAGFRVNFPSYGELPAVSDYMSFYSVVSGTARWRNASGNLEMKTSDGTHFSYWNNNGWMDFPLNNTSPTEAWTFYLNSGVRPAYITASFKSSAMKSIALKEYVDEVVPSATSDLVNDSGFITASAIPSNVGAFNNDVGYLTASSSSFTNKRDYDDLTNPGSIYPSETHRIREFYLNIEGGYNPSRYTLNKFSTNVPNYGSMWANDEEYWNFAVATSNGEDFTFNKYGESGEVATFTMSDVTAGAITFTMTDDEIEYTCHLSASMYETTLALKDYVDANLNVSGIGCSTVTMSGVYADTTTFSYNVVVQPSS